MIGSTAAVIERQKEITFVEDLPRRADRGVDGDFSPGPNLGNTCP